MWRSVGGVRRKCVVANEDGATSAWWLQGSRVGLEPSVCVACENASGEADSSSVNTAAVEINTEHEQHSKSNIPRPREADASDAPSPARHPNRLFPSFHFSTLPVRPDALLNSTALPLAGLD